MSSEKDMLLLSNWDDCINTYVKLQLAFRGIKFDDCGKQFTDGKIPRCFTTVWSFYEKDRQRLLDLIEFSYRDPVAMGPFWNKVAEFNKDPKEYINRMINTKGIPAAKAKHGELNEGHLMAIQLATIKTVECCIIYGLRFYLLSKDGSYNEYDLPNPDVIPDATIALKSSGMFDDLIKDGEFFEK